MTGWRSWEEPFNERMLALGFEGRGGGLYTLPLGTDVLGWLFIEAANRSTPIPGGSRDTVSLWPRIGVYHTGVEKTLAAHVKRPARQFLTPTAEVALARLAGENWPAVRMYGVPAWTYRLPADPGEVVGLIASLIGDLGLDWIRDHVALDRIEAHLAGAWRPTNHVAAALRWPLTLACLDRPAECLEAIGQVYALVYGGPPAGYRGKESLQDGEFLDWLAAEQTAAAGGGTGPGAGK
jgi:hypothetical protein